VDCSAPTTLRRHPLVRWAIASVALAMFVLALIHIPLVQECMWANPRAFWIVFLSPLQAIAAAFVAWFVCGRSGPVRLRPVILALCLLVLVSAVGMQAGSILYIKAHPALNGGAKAAATQNSLFPAPTHESGTLLHVMQMFNTLAKEPVAETTEEKALRYNDFDPKELPNIVLQPAMIPPEFSHIWLKKLHWWPQINMEQQSVVQAEPATICRYTQNGFNVQITEDVVRTVFIIQPVAGKLDITPDAAINNLPACYRTIFQSMVLNRKLPSYFSKEDYSMVGGGTLHRYEGMDLNIPATISGAPFFGVAYWTDSVCVFAITRTHPETGRSKGAKSLFITTPSSREYFALEHTVCYSPQ